MREAFAALGHKVLSCDLKPSRIAGPHYQGDVFDVIDYPWDLGVFHPYCTDASVSGAKHFAAKWADGRVAACVAFWMRLWRRAEHIEQVVFEHPVSIMSTHFRKPDQIIQPWMFGDYETKDHVPLDAEPAAARADLQDRRRMPRGAWAAARHQAEGSHPQDAARPAARG